MTGTREEQVLERIDRARRRKARISDERITLSHGSGGKATHTLIAVFLEAFRNPLLEPPEDQGCSRWTGGAWRSPPTRSWCRRCSSQEGPSATSP